MARGIKRFNGMVRRAMMTPHRSRIRFDKSTITAATVTPVTLLTVDDEPNYDTTSDGTNVAEAEALSRLMKIDLNLSFFSGTSNAAGALVEWMLYRDPDAQLGTETPSTLFTADVSATTAMVRKNVLAYGGFYSSANNDTKAFRIGIRRKAMQRVRRLSDGDKIMLVIITAATGAKLFGHGAITWAK